MTTSIKPTRPSLDLRFSFDRCGPGTYGAHGDSVAKDNTFCKKCKNGNYCSGYGVVEPVACPAGKFAPDVIEADLFGLKSLKECLDCPSGQYSNTVELISISDCKQCPTGTTSPTGSTTFENCGLSCDPGKKPVDGKCQGCLPGFMGNTLGTKCILCQRGFFQAKTGAMECDKCNKDDGLCQNNAGAILTVSNPLPKELTFFEPLDDDVAYIDSKNEDNNDEEGSYTDEFNKAQKEGLEMKAQYVFYFGFLSVISMTISLHRLCPPRCKVLDLLFAGDHFISDKVSLSTKVQVISCMVSVLCTDIVSSILILVSKRVLNECTTHD